MVLGATLLGGRYELTEPIGTGGFSEVWRATDTVLSRPVAVKVLQASYARQAEALARFQAEARHAGALSHENIACIYDYAEPADGEPYLVMELVDGPSLASLLTRGPLDAGRTMDVVAQAAAGLQAAHGAGLIHRDIKPANLLLSPAGTVKITDFGIAHAVGSAPVTMTGTLIGTPGYLAPERVAGAQATPASDLYALGIVAYECLAGAPPFTGVPLEVALAHRERPLPPLPLSVPVEVGAFVMQLTAKDACWRPGSAAKVARRAAALRDALSAGTAGMSPGARAAAAGAPVAGEDRWRPPHRAPGRPPGNRPRHPSALAVACLMLAVLTGFVLAGVLGFAPVLRQVGVPSIASPASAQASSPAGRTADGHRAGRAPARTASPAPGQLVRDPAAATGAGNQTDLTGAKPAGKPRHDPGRGHRTGPGKTDLTGAKPRHDPGRGHRTGPGKTDLTGAKPRHDPGRGHRTGPGKQESQGSSGKQKSKGTPGAGADGKGQSLTG